MLLLKTNVNKKPNGSKNQDTWNEILAIPLNYHMEPAKSLYFSAPQHEGNVHLPPPLGYLIGISNFTCPNLNYQLLPPLPVLSLSLSLRANGKPTLPIAQANNLGVIQDTGFWTYATFIVRLSMITFCKIILPSNST